MTVPTALPLSIPPVPPTSSDRHAPSTPPRAPRGRSDTMLSTSSSSSSFPTIQTPQMSMMTNILGATHQTSPNGLTLSESPSESFSIPISGERRKSSYGFGESFRTSPPPQSPSYLYRESLNTPRLSMKEKAVLAAREEVDPPFQRPLTPMPFTLAELDGPEPLLRRSSWGQHHSNIPPPTDGVQSVVQSSATSETDRSEGMIAEPAPVSKPGLSLRTTMKKKIERSKSAFSILRNSTNGASANASTPNDSTESVPLSSSAWDSSAINTSHQAVRLKRSRLKSLLSMSRNHSSSSVRSASRNTRTSDEQQPTVSSMNESSLAEGYIHGSVTPPVDNARCSDFPSRQDKGKGRSGSEPHPYTLPCDFHDNPSIQSRPGYTGGIARHRALSMPLPDTQQPGLLSMLQAEHEELQPDLFDSVLPHELQVMVFRKLLDSYHGQKTGRWSGTAGGRKELVKLSRLDPFAHLLHFNTFERIISSSLPFITELNLRGLDALTGANLLASLTMVDPETKGKSAEPPISLPNLRRLDLRGCKGLTSFDVCLIILGAPALRSINLKGVHAVTPEVLHAIRKVCKNIESLDISRCGEITLGDVAILIRGMDDRQASKLRVLKVAGIRSGRTSYGHHPSDFLPLLAKRAVNLQVLDLQGCPNLDEQYFKQYREMLDSMGQDSSIQHLNVSGCTGLRKPFFAYLKGRCPELTRLELADLPGLFSSRADEDDCLVAFLKTVPKLQRLDLEGTGAHGGVTDKVLNTLAIGRDENGQRVGKELVELRIGFAKAVTSESILRVMRWCTKLEVLEADNTSADDSILREYSKRHGRPSRSLSVVDCHAVSPGACKSICESVRLRAGFEGWEAVPFDFEAGELGDIGDGGHDNGSSIGAGDGNGVEREASVGPEAGDESAAAARAVLGAGLGTGNRGRKILKTNYSWKDAKPPSGWREAREKAERAAESASDNGSRNGGKEGSDDEPGDGEGEDGLGAIRSRRAMRDRSCVIM